MKTFIIIAVVVILIVAAVITHERDPEKKIHLQEHQPPKKDN